MNNLLPARLKPCMASRETPSATAQKFSEEKLKTFSDFGTKQTSDSLS